MDGPIYDRDKQNWSEISWGNVLLHFVYAIIHAVCYLSFGYCDNMVIIQTHLKWTITMTATFWNV